jgi:hypothetical protein
VWIYEYDAGTWTPTAELHASNWEEGAGFGCTVALDGDTLVVGAHHAFTGVPGEAYVFRFDGTSWTEEARLVPTESRPGDWFGEGLAVEGNRVVVGAPGHNDTGLWAGAVYVFRKQGGTWSQEARLEFPDAAPYLSAGNDVALQGSRIVVGCIGPTTTGGALRVYHLTPAGWLLDFNLMASDAPLFGALGYEVDLQDDLVIGGAPGVDGVAENTGAAYVFTVPPPPGPGDRLEGLAADVEALDLPPGIENALLAKLDTALAQLQGDNEANDAAAVGALEAFIQQVEAQAGKMIPQSAADDLIAVAQLVIALVEGA